MTEPSSPMRAALYTRVSKRDDSQTTDNQTPALEEYCRDKGWHIVVHYDEQGSAGGARDRPGFRQMMADAARRRFQVLVVWSLDRFSREGTRQTIHDLNLLDFHGVRFVSVTEQYLDTCGLFRDAVIGILAAVANMERVRLSERVKAGLERARSEGRRLGRRPAKVDLDALSKAVEADWSYNQMCEVFKISRTTLFRQLRQLKERTEPAVTPP